MKPNLEENDMIIKENIRGYGGNVGPKMLAQMKMTEVLKKQMDTGEFDMDVKVEISAKMSDKRRIESIKQKLQHELKSEKHSISAVAELKVYTDTADNFLIYKIESLCLIVDCSYAENLSYTERLSTETFN